MFGNNKKKQDSVIFSIQSHGIYWICLSIPDKYNINYKAVMSEGKYLVYVCIRFDILSC